jgi:hypothetical protein
MRRRVGLLLLVMLALTGCMSQFRARCTAYGFLEGTPEHAYCTQRAVERFEDGLRNMKLGNPQFQYQQTQPLPKPTTWCDSTRVGNTVSTTCY